jgi:hypothetical protein
MENPSSSPDSPRPSDDTGVLPAEPGTGTTDTQLFREIKTLEESRSEFPLPSPRPKKAVYLALLCLALAIAAIIAFKLHIFGAK